MADKKKRSSLYRQIFIGVGVALVALLPAGYEIKKKQDKINEKKRLAYEEKSGRIFWSFYRAIGQNEVDADDIKVRFNDIKVRSDDIKVKISAFLDDADGDGDGYITQGEFHEALHRYYLK